MQEVVCKVLNLDCAKGCEYLGLKLENDRVPPDLVNFFVLFLTIFGLEAGVSAIASERLTFKFQESFDEEKLSRFRRQINECYCCST